MRILIACLAGCTLSATLHAGEARVVARLELTAPETRPFLLHATLPVPKGVWPRADGRSSFRIRFPGKAERTVPAQVEIVSRYPTGEADVVELIARGELEAGVRANARVTCAVLLEDEPEEGDPGVPDVPEATRKLVDRTRHGPIFVRARDVFGHRYVAELNGNPDGIGFGSARVEKRGRWLEEERVFATLAPVPGQPEREGAPLAHLMGVHAYVTKTAVDEAVALDLRVSNGAIAGNREPSALETTLGIVYWTSFELVLPRGWTAVAEVRDPFLGEAYDDGDYRVIPIVKPYQNGALHMMGPQAQFERRFVLVPVGKESIARARLAWQGLAFPLRGENLWSWTNPETARYFPQRDVLASVDLLRRGDLSGKAAVLAADAAALAELRAGLETGTARGYYVEAGVMGWAHPWFIADQGGFGGEGIATIEGHYAAAAASRDGVAYLALLHRMNVCRQPEATYDAQGDSVGYRRWLGSDGKIPFDYRTHGGVVLPAFRLPMNGGPACSEQVRAVVKRGLRPPYDIGTPFEADGGFELQNDVLLAWWPHDDQHLVRYTKNTKALVWLSNDALAKDDLRLSAELFRLMFHESPHVEADWSPGLTLRVWETLVQKLPHAGLPLGREHAWGIDAMCAAYSVGTPEWRAQERPWFARVARLLDDAAQPSGLVNRVINERLLGHTKYMAAQCFECLLLVHAMRCMDESVFRGVDEGARTKLEALARRTAEYLFFGPPWQRIESDYQPDPDHPTIYLQGPRQGIAVSLNDERATPVFSDAKRWGANYLPKDGLGGGVEIVHVWAALAYVADSTQESAGKGLENRYLLRARDCSTPHASFKDLLHDLWNQAADVYQDNSVNWIGLAGRLQNLGVR